MHSGARSTPHAPPACDPPRFHGDSALPIGRGGGDQASVVAQALVLFTDRALGMGPSDPSIYGMLPHGGRDLGLMGLRTVLHSSWRPSILVNGWKPLSSLERKRCATGLFSVPARLDPSAGRKRAAARWRRRLPKRLPAVRQLPAPRKPNASRETSAVWERFLGQFGDTGGRNVTRSSPASTPGRGKETASAAKKPLPRSWERRSHESSLAADVLSPRCHAWL